MRFLVVNTDYGPFMASLYGQNPGLAACSFAEQARARMDTLFGTADFYSRNLAALGHEAWDVIANLEPAQRAWAAEHDLPVPAPWRWRTRRGFVPWPYRDRAAWLGAILEAQVKAYRPDVLYVMCMETVDSAFLRRVTGYYRLAIGQHAATPLQTDFGAYDLVLSSLPNQVDFFRSQGLRSELLLLGFEPAILDRLTGGEKAYDIVFAGAVGGIHGERTRTLEALARHFPLAIWGYGADRLSPDSPLRRQWRGQLWGREMYETLGRARLVFNGHSDLVDRYFANNMRLYEATGVGSLLLTDDKPNLPALFIPGREVLAYRGVKDCLALAEYYLGHEAERETLARAGQRRTLAQHTWRNRMAEMVEIAGRYL